MSTTTDPVCGMKVDSESRHIAEHGLGVVEVIACEERKHRQTQHQNRAVDLCCYV